MPRILLPLLVFASLWSATPAFAKKANPAVDTVRVMRAFQDAIGRVNTAVTPSVVYIEAVQKMNTIKQKVTGSGFVVSKDGYILTNEHVVSKAEKVEVSLLNDRRRYRASVVGLDAQTDIALLKIDPPADLPVPRFGDSDDVVIGEGVLAIGNPLGLDGTVSFGIVSAKGRNLNYGPLINDFIQTDAMIDHGSSGGPLVNLEGEIIGVNSMGQGRGIGFTIPINTALAVKNQLVKAGKLHRGWLGVTVQPLDSELAAFLGQPDLTGVVVNNVLPGSPAEKAGIRREDILTDVDGVRIETESENDLNAFRRILANVEPKTKATVGVVRAGKPLRVSAVFGEQPRLEGDIAETTYGFSVQEITDHMLYNYRLPASEGVLVNYVESGGVAAEAGLVSGEIVQNVNGKPVKTLADFQAAVDGVKSGGRFLVKALAGDNLRYHLIVPYQQVWNTAQSKQD